MKNLHYLKKFVVMVLAAMMTLSTFALPTFAATGNVTITGLEPGVTPTAYKIADVDTQDAVKRITQVPKARVNDLYNPTTNEIMDLAANTPAGLTQKVGTAVAENADSTTLSGLAPGVYLVKFASTSSVKYIYNPVIVSVKNDGTAVVGDLKSYKDTTKAKKSTVPFEKVVERTDSKLPANDKGSNVGNEATEGDDDKINGGNRGDTAAKGDTVSFRIDTKIPYYGDNYFTDNDGVDNPPQFQIYDTLDGLTLKQDSVKVYANGSSTALTEGTDYTIEKTATSFTISLKEATIKNNREKAIEVRYSATVNDTAERVNFNPDTNTAGCKYSNNPNTNTLAETEKRTTYHYKFTINGNIKGNSGKENREVIKVGIDESTGEQLFVEQTSGVVDLEGWQTLENVKFKLYDNEDGEGTPVRGNVYSDENGILRGMDQLDAGTYYLIEDATQEVFETGKYKDNKYKTNTNPIKIEITAKLLDDGRLDSYMIKIADTIVGNYKADYKNDYDLAKGTMIVDHAGDPNAQDGGFYEVNGTALGEGVEIKKDHNIVANGTTTTFKDHDKAVEILNTKVGTLPSTGGMGTVLFTIGGIAIMGLALLLLFGGKKKQHQK